MGKKIVFIALAVFLPLSCENPIQAGLGGKVDITVPVITMDNPRNMGDHVKGVFELKINAQDDIGVAKVQVAITKDTEGNSLPEGSWKWEDAVLDPISGLWIYPVDTKKYPDGDLPVMIRAEDATGKSVIFEGMYSSKNNPPEIELQIPAVPEDPEKRMELVTGGVMIGIAKDLWGIAPGYPKIQFWHESEGENPSDPYLWKDMDTYAARSAADWAASPNGRTALEFQFYAVDRNKAEPGTAVKDMPGLEPGTYRFRFQAKDVDGTNALTTYPAAGYYEVDVIAVRELPVITVTAKPVDPTASAGQYHREPFYITADVSHTTGIFRATIEVQKEGVSGSSVLARGVYTGNVTTGTGVNTTLTRRLETHLIYPDGHYIYTDVADPENTDIGAVDDYLFTDGTYTFTIYATSYQTSYARLSLTVYIDTTPPEISITRVQPNVEAVNIPGGLDEYTVNGFIAVDMSAYDANNIGVFVPDPDPEKPTSYREIKYLIRDDLYSPNPADLYNQIKALYDNSAAQYFDNPAPPVYPRTNSTSAVIIDTTAIVPEGDAFYTPRNKYLHFIAKDKAGNYGFTAALLRVDQSTDIPRITITGFDSSQRSPADLKAAAYPNRILDANRMLSGTFEDDDGVLIGAVPGDSIKFKIYQDGDPDPKADIPVTADELIVLNDGKTVNFNIALPPAPEPGSPAGSSSLDDGTYSVEVEVSDSIVKKNVLKPVLDPEMTDLRAEVFNTTGADTETPKRGIYFVLDTQPPVLTENRVIKDTSNDPRLAAARFSLGGNISDVNGLRSLKIIQTQMGPGGEVISVKTIVNDEETYNGETSADWELLALPQEGDPDLPPESGTFKYEITAMDVAQRPTTLARWVVVDTEPPVLTVTQPAELADAWVHNSIVVVEGTETDNYRPGPVFYRIEKALGAPDTSQFKDSLAEYLGDTNDDGESDIDSGWKKLTVMGGGKWSDSVNFREGATPLGEGKFYLYVAAFDEAGHQTRASVRTFGVDYNAPYMKNWAAPNVIEINDSYYAKGPYTLSFNAYDSNALYTGGTTPSVQVKATGVADNLVTGTHPELGGYTLTINQADTTTWTWPVSLTLANPADGNISYEFIITDASGSPNTLDNLPGLDADMHKRITVRTDRQGPSISIAEPYTGQSIAGDSLKISGVATDTGIPEGVEVYYTVTNGTLISTPPATRAAAFDSSSGWFRATEDASWDKTFTLASAAQGEGGKRIYFAAYDQLDNWSLESKTFYVDAAAPHITTWTSSDVTTNIASNLIGKDNFTFTFTAFDSNALQEVNITRGEGDAKETLSVGSATSDGFGSYTITKTLTDDQHWTYAASFTDQEDGNYVYGIEITDIAGKTNPEDNAPDTAKRYKTFNVRIDTTGPVLAFNEPADNSTVSGSKITIGGTAQDSLTPAGVTVWYVIDGNGTIAEPARDSFGIPVLTSWTQTDGGADWYKNADLPSGGEGQRYVHVVAYDQLWNPSTVEGEIDPTIHIAHKPFYVDISPPIIDDFNFIDITTDAGVNFARKDFARKDFAGEDYYGFIFKAKDSNALDSVKVSRDGTPLFTATGAVPSGTGTGYTYTVAVNSAKEWTVTVNFTDQDDGNYAFNIEVTDIAGRENALDNNTSNDSTDDYKTFGVRVDTTGPVLTIVDPVANMAASGNRLYIGGTAPDTNDLTSDGITAYYKIDAAPNTAAPANLAATIADLTWTEAPGGAFWANNAVLDSSGEEGYRYLHVIAYDKLGNAGNLAHRPFFVDVNPPQILNWDDSASTGINFSSTPYYAGEDYTIKFDAYDSNTLAGGSPALSQSLVKITRNGVELDEGPQSGYTLTIDKTSGIYGARRWGVTLALTGQADGNYSYSIEIRDATGKENTLDNSTTADTLDDHKSFTIVVDGTAPDTSLTMAPATVSNEGQDFVLANGALFRSDNVNGVIRFAASAMDSSGLEGVKWFIIPDSPDPAFDPATNAKSLYDDTRGTLLLAEDSYTALYDTTLITDRTHYSLYILARDKAGNVGYNSSTSFTFYVDQRTDRPVVTLTNLSKDGNDDPVVGRDFILRGTVKDDDGVDPATIKINLSKDNDWYTGIGTDWTSNSPVDLTPTTITGSGREISFTYNFPSGMFDGPDYKVAVKAADLPASKTGSGNTTYSATNAAKEGSTETTFELDNTPPVVEVDLGAHPIDSTYKETASISGTLKEMHLDVFRVRIDAEGYANYIEDSNPDAGSLVLTSWDDETGEGTWTYKLPILETPPLSVGLHTVTLEAVDKAGLSTTVLWRFYVDNEGPVISFRIDEIDYPTWGTVPAGMNILREGGLALRGDFRDDFSAVDASSFDYRFDDQTDWTATDSTTASTANPGRNPTWTLNLDNLPSPYASLMPDGPHRVQIRVRDALGNSGVSGWVGFRVDTADPTITDILPSEADAVFGNTGSPVFTLTGTAADANLSSVTLTLNGASTNPITVSPGEASVGFTYEVTSVDFTQLPQGANRFTITAVDEAGRSKTVEWNFIKDTDPPTIEWSNLNDQTGDNSSLFQDQANLKIMGVAKDTNGVATLTSTIEKYIGNAWVTVDSAFNLAPANEAVKNWIKDVAILDGTALSPTLDGRYRITINAVDRGGNSVTTPAREFRVDLAMPTVAIDTNTGTYPLKLFYNGKNIGSGPIQVSGTATDANGITGVTAKLSGTNAPAWAEATATYNAGVWEVTIPHVNPDNPSDELPQGGYTLNVTARDGAGRTNTAYGPFTYDSVDPTSTIDLPVKYGRVTGSVSIRGSNNDMGSGVSKMEYQFTNEDSSWREVIITNPPTDWSGGLYSWNYTFTTGGYIGDNYGREVRYDAYTGAVTAESGTGLWEVPFKVKVTDQAGNEKIIDDYFLLLDQFGDIPRIEISNPASGSVLGGRVFISGTANDNNYINRIQYRVLPDPTPIPDWSGIEWIHNTPTSGDFLTGSGIGSNVTWQFDINGDGEYNPASGEGLKTVLVQVRAVDAPQGYPNDLNGSYSDPVSIIIYFDAGVPRISGERVANRAPGPINFPALMDDTNSVAYVEGLQVSKYFVFEASIQDDSGLETIQYWRDGQLNGANALGTSEVIAPTIRLAPELTKDRKYMIDDPGNTDWVALGASSNTHGATFIANGSGSGSGTAYEATPAGEFVYKLRFSIPSDTLPAYMDKTGHFTINIMALDNSSPQLRADRSYTLQVDNFYPFGTYTSPNVAAGYYNIRGTARDFDSTSGPIQGLDKVVVYFSRDGSFIPLHEDGSTVGYDNHPWNATAQEQEVRNTVNPGKTTVPFPADKYSGIFIDWDETGAGLDQDLDGYLEGWYDNGADKVWSARFDSLQLKDGPVTVHYVIFDKAGNATYYEKTVFIKNHAPVIKSVTLGTDIFGDKTIRGTRLYTTGYFTNPAFVARNQRLSFNVAKLYGNVVNGPAQYRITPVTRAQISVMAIVVGDIYTIDTVGDTDWVAVGAPDNNVGTTFVASSNGNGNGTVFKYDALSGFTPKVGNVTQNSDSETGNVLFSGTDFGKGAGQIPDLEDAYFLIKVWDTTVSGGAEDQQLSDQIVVRVKIENEDAVVPTSRLYDLSPHAKNQSKYDIVTTLGNLWPDGIGEDKNMRYGGLYRASDAVTAAISGHVEPRGGDGVNSIFLETGVPSTYPKDTVSGKVILRGYARDNQRISGIQIKFGNTVIPIIRVNADPTTIVTGQHFGALEPVPTVRAWVYDDLSLDEHLVEWAYEWDTEKTDGMAVVGDITVEAISWDAKVGTYNNTDGVAHTLDPNRSVSVNQSLNNVTYNTIGMTAAPYITSLARGGGYNTLRSKQGWNSFRRSSTGAGTLEAAEEVSVNGFNLSLSGKTGAAVTVNNVAITPLTDQSFSKVTFNLPSDAKSGAFGLTVSGIQAVNNRNDNRNTWNKEASATVEGSALWNDDRNVHVWQTNNTNTNTNRGYFVGSEKPIHPAMTKHPTTGVLHASWSNYAAASLYRGANNAGATSTFNGYDPPEHTDIHYAIGSNINDDVPTIAYNQNYWAGTGWNNIREQGGMAVFDNGASAIYAGTGNAYMAESLWHDKILAQFENPRVVTKGNAIHISYYDTDTKSLKYWYNTKSAYANTSNTSTTNTNVSWPNYTGTTSRTGNTTTMNAPSTITLGGNSYSNNRWINLDGGFDGHDIYIKDRVLGRIGGGTAGNGNSGTGNASTTTPTFTAETASSVNVSGNRGSVGEGDSSSTMAGEFSAIDLTSDGYPVIAYYDITNQTVKLAYSQAEIPLVSTAQNASIPWKRQNVLASSDPNYTFSGRYISMRIDTRSGMNNRIHMVFYRTSSGDLIYVTGTQTGSDGSYTFEPSVIIDSVGNVGKWADLSLDANGNPWVSYADSSWFDSFDAVKMAYCITSNNQTGAVNATSDGLLNPDKWEVMTMPTIYNVADKRISIENWDATTGANSQFWSAAIGYAADDFFRIGYYIKPTITP